MSTGWAHACAVRESGELVCWGWEGLSAAVVDAPAGRFRSVSAGTAHSCAVRESGGIVCWGYNPYGQIDAPAGSFRSVSVGYSHSCAVRESGEIACWGAASPWTQTPADLR